MRFYQVQRNCDHPTLYEIPWFTNRKDAEKEVRRIAREEGEECFDIRAFDIPTTKAALLRWLNNHGNPDGMGTN